jgi:histidinol-phosphate phosphatase family protein
MSVRPAVFLDRDGTLIEDRHYLRDPAGVRLLPGAAGAVRRLNAAGLPAVLVTNQSGIARGLLTEADYEATAARLDDLLAAEGARLDARYHCPHLPEISGPCECRKPGPSLFLRAAHDHGLDLAESWWVGDQPRDVEPAASFGGRGVLLRSPDGGASVGGWMTAPDLGAAVDVILGEGSAAGSRRRRPTAGT